MDLPSSSALTEHEELQRAWETFIKECKLAVEVKSVLTRSKAQPATQPLDQPDEGTWPIQKDSHAGQETEPFNRNLPAATHVFTDEEIVQCFLAGYHSDKAFASFVDRTRNESLLEHK